jgi:hypothetical protein
MRTEILRHPALPSADLDLLAEMSQCSLSHRFKVFSRHLYHQRYHGEVIFSVSTQLMKNIE